MNLSNVSDEQTASTCYDAALQRAENLCILSAKNVLELCVGPSLKTLESCYKKFNINVTGNDIDRRWKNYYVSGDWIIADALKVNYDGFDWVVFAPPLSKGCSGARNDSLGIDSVSPGYIEFLRREPKQAVLTLPARSIATSKDRQQFHRLLSYVGSIGYNFDVVELFSGSRKIRKYVDVYITR